MASTSSTVGSVANLVGFGDGGAERGGDGGPMNDFKGRHFEGQIILWAVRWFCKYGVSHRELEEMLEERGVAVDHTTIYRWTQRYAPLIEKRLRWYWRRPRSTSWRVDETYVKVRGRWAYLYRAIDKRGDTVDFHLSPTRSAKAAKRFLGKVLQGLKTWERPVVINTDKAGCYGPAIAALKKEGRLPKDTQHRQVQYLNNRLEADHGKLKRLIKPTLGFQSMRTAYATIKGFEVMRALKKGQGALFRFRPRIAGEVDLVNRNFGLC
jgi:transposase-like protein